MSAKKRKETLEKKQKANKSKKANEIENLQEEIETDITEESSEMLEVADYLINKERNGL